MPVALLPGDNVETGSSSLLKIGPGLARTNATSELLVASVPGVLGRIDVSSSALRGKGKGKKGDAMQLSKDQVAYWVETTSKKYIPAVHDSVVVQVTNRGPESYQCTLFTSSTPSSLPSLAFEGATKRSKPNIRVGSLLYATVVSAGRHVESELSCFASESGKSEGFGELKVENGEGIATIFPVSCGLARSLLDRKHPLLSQVAAHFPFETAIGMNGLIWVRAASPKQVVAIGQILRHSDERARELAFGKEMMTARSGSGIEQDALITSQGRGLLQPDEIALIIDRNR